jgi:hypothetical protein
VPLKVMAEEKADVRAVPWSRPFAPSWWEISFGEPLICCTVHVG